MRVLIVGDGPAARELAQALGESGITAELHGDGPPVADGPEEIQAIARGLREFERALGPGGPDAVIVASDSSTSLAATIVATKLGTPVARLERSDEDRRDDANARLMRQLADAALAPEPAAIVAWVRGGYPARA